MVLGDIWIKNYGSMPRTEWPISSGLGRTSKHKRVDEMIKGLGSAEVSPKQNEIWEWFWAMGFQVCRTYLGSTERNTLLNFLEQTLSRRDVLHTGNCQMGSDEVLIPRSHTRIWIILQNYRFIHITPRSPQLFDEIMFWGLSLTS